jgi:hypothetical protein
MATINGGKPIRLMAWKGSDHVEFGIDLRYHPDLTASSETFVRGRGRSCTPTSDVHRIAACLCEAGRPDLAAYVISDIDLDDLTPDERHLYQRAEYLTLIASTPLDDVG